MLSRPMCAIHLEWSVDRQNASTSQENYIFVDFSDDYVDLSNHYIDLWDPDVDLSDIKTENRG